MNRVREIRKRKKLRLFDVMREADISLGYLQSIEAGCRCSEKCKKKLAKALNVPLEELFPTDTPPPTSCKD